MIEGQKNPYKAILRGKKYYPIIRLDKLLSGELVIYYKDEYNKVWMTNAAKKPKTLKLVNGGKNVKSTRSKQKEKCRTD